MEWEVVKGKASIERLKVAGGWIVKHREIVRQQVPAQMILRGGMNPQIPPIVNMSICFMPDPNHVWLSESDDGFNKTDDNINLAKPK